MRRLAMVLLAILFLFMVFAGPATQKADAVVVSTVVIGTVIAAMAAAGIGLTVSGLTSSQLQDWVSGKLNEWSSSLGGTVQDHIDNNLITVTGSGILAIGTAAADGIADFIDWLKVEDNIADNSTQTIIGDVLVLRIDDDLYHPVCNDGGTYWSIKRKGNYVLYAVGINGGGSYGPLMAWEGDNQEFYLVRDSAYASPDYTGYSVILSRDTYDYASNGVRLNWNQGWNWYGSNPNMGGATQIYSSRQAGLDAIGLAIRSGNYSDTLLSYDTEVISVPTIDQTDKWFLDVGADPGATVDTVTDGVIADTIEGSLSVSGEVSEEEPEFEVTGPVGVSGLTEIFPFCIPFDVYALLSCLSAEPQTPVFTVRFVIPGVINQEFTIDLSPFSTIAQIVRTMELIAFAIGLALVTRERFLRS